MYFEMSPSHDMMRQRTFTKDCIPRTDAILRQAHDALLTGMRGLCGILTDDTRH